MKSLSRSCAEEVMGAVPPVVWHLRRRMRGNRGKLSMPQFRALVRFECEPAVSISAVAEHLGISLSSTSRLVSGLVRRGYLARETAPADRRQVHVAITSKGRAVLQTAREATRRELESLFTQLGVRDQTLLIDAMQVLRRVFAGSMNGSVPNNRESRVA
jgi:DNA-binding MarR family transcriptional regulator